MLIIQARMGSKRLPGKVLLPFAGTTVIGSVIDRCMETGEDVVVAMPDTPENDVLALECEKHGAGVFRGSESDVLSRYYECAKHYGAMFVGRVTADCPLIDTELMVRMMRCLYNGHYISNVEQRSYPKGLDFEYFSFTALKKAHEQATEPYDREHVTPWIQRNIRQRSNYKTSIDLSYINLSLDTKEDYRRLCDLDKMRSRR